VPERVELVLHGRHVTLGRNGPFGDDEDRGVARLVAAFDQRAHRLDVERLLRNQDDVGAAGQSRVQGDPAGVAAHHLDDHGAVM
jgi:hypothetical protein